MMHTDRVDAGLLDNSLFFNDFFSMPTDGLLRRNMNALNNLMALQNKKDIERVFQQKKPFNVAMGNLQSLSSKTENQKNDIDSPQTEEKNLDSGCKCKNFKCECCTSVHLSTFNSNGKNSKLEI